MLKNPDWTLDEAIRYFDRKNEREQIPNRKSGGYRRVSDVERRVIMADVRNAMTWASGVSCPGSEKLAPYLEVLEHFARVGAEEDGRSRPENRVSSVRLFLLVVEGNERKGRRRVLAESFLPAWKPLHDAVRSLRDANPNARQPIPRRYGGFLYSFQTFLQRHGISDPRAIPSYEQLKKWAEAEALANDWKPWRQQFHNWLTAYRCARMQLQDPALPDLAHSPIGFHRGLRGLELGEMLRRRNCTIPPRDLTTEELLRVLAPQIAQAVDCYIEHRARSKDWAIAVVTAASCLVAELIRMGREGILAEMDLIDLFETRVTIETPRAVSASTLLERRLGHTTSTSTVSLLRQYADEAASRSFKNSPIRLMEAVPAGQPVAWYTHALFDDLSALWSVTEFVYGSGAGATEGGMSAHRPEEWSRIHAEYRLVREHMKTVNGSRKAEGFKDRGLIDVTLAQAVCVGLPRLWKRARKLRAAYHIACGKHAEGDAAPVAVARKRYFRALQRYILSAVLLDDGLRVANYAGARAGKNFIPQVEREADGSWRRIVGVETYFRGFCAEAKLKIAKDARGKERERRRTLRRGVVDMDLMTDFWLELRPCKLAACGLIPSVEAYDPDQDSFAFFVSPWSKQEGHGGYRKQWLSKQFGQVLHWIMREAMGRDVESWREIMLSKELRRKWRGLFGAHATRTLISTYWGVVREKWSVAQELTNDQLRTLHLHYSVFEGWVTEARTLTGIEHPDHFNQIMDLLRNGSVIDWASFDPARPEAATVVGETGQQVA